MTAVVTIGLPVYNGEGHLRETVEAMLAQTFGDFVLVVSDNGSQDSTPDILAELARADSRVEVRRSPENRGAAWNYNAVATDVRTPLFKWIAHDDLHDPTYLERCVEVLATDPGAVAVHSRARYIDDVGHEVGRSFRREGFADAAPSSRIAEVLFSGHDYTFAFAMMRTAALRQLRPFEPVVAADEIMLVELALRGRMVQLDEHLFANRLHMQSSKSTSVGAGLQAGYQSWWGGPGFTAGGAPAWEIVERLWSAVTLSPVEGRERRLCLGVVARYGRRHYRGLTLELPALVRHRLPSSG